MKRIWGPSPSNQDSEPSPLIKIKSVNIHQLSVLYVAEHDRILARINTTAGEELRLWLTRRLMCQLWPMLDKVVAEQVASQGAADRMPLADPQAKAALSEFERSKMLRGADFKTPFTAQATKLPLGAEPLLVTDVNIKPQVEGKLRLQLTERLPDSGQAAGAERSFNMLLNAQLSHGLTHLLHKAIVASQWPMEGFGSRLATDANVAAQAAADAPKYLN